MDRLKLMATYESVVRLGGYTPASKELGVTRAMISKRIQDLEEALNVKLLNRTTQRIGMTATGVRYYKDCQTILADIRTVEERLQSRRQELKGDLKILCSKTFGELVLAPILVRFCSEHPGLRPHLVLRTMARDEHDLISSGFDISVRPREIENTSLVAKPIASLPRVVVAAPSYLERHGSPATPQDLLKLNCLTPNGEGSSDWTFLEHGHPVTIRSTGTLTSSSSTVVRHAAIQGLGIALIGQYVVEDDLKAGRLVTVLKNFTLPRRMLHVVYQKDQYQPRRVRMFIDYLSQQLALAA
jgi:DNA-binding transcriptional LysR family regulator